MGSEMCIRDSHFSDALYRFPFLGLFSWPMAAVALGVAQRALDEMTAMALAKTPRLGTGTLREQPLFQLQLEEPWRTCALRAPGCTR